MNFVDFVVIRSLFDVSIFILLHLIYVFSILA